MGEIADDIVNGACCSWCGEYFSGEHGYPVLCVKCWKEARGQPSDPGLQQAHLPPAGGEEGKE